MGVESPLATPLPRPAGRLQLVLGEDDAQHFIHEKAHRVLLGGGLSQGVAYYTVDGDHPQVRVRRVIGQKLK